jgi:hypothetical protein
MLSDYNFPILKPSQPEPKMICNGPRIENLLRQMECGLSAEGMIAIRDFILAQQEWLLEFAKLAPEFPGFEPSQIDGVEFLIEKLDPQVGFVGVEGEDGGDGGEGNPSLAGLDAAFRGGVAEMEEEGSGHDVTNATDAPEKSSQPRILGKTALADMPLHPGKSA